jgi:uncharacterized membrane-anchored protein
MTSTRVTRPTNVGATIAGVLLLQLGLVGVAVAPQLSARVAGDEYLFRVAPYDPIDPFRGAYVDLTYPDLRLDDPDPVAPGPQGDDRGSVYVTLQERDGVWVAADYVGNRPGDGPYLTCDDHGWQLRCGIESWFLPQADAARFEDLVRSGRAVARVRIDGRGHAALMGVEQR